jgi:hypothetical protein
MTEEKRARGILSTVDREWLRGEKEYDHRQQTYDRRKKIRDRVRNSIMDYPVLMSEWGYDELEHAVDPLKNSDAHKQGLTAGLVDGVALLFAANAAAYSAGRINDPEMYETLVSDAISRACRFNGIAADVGVNVEIDTIGTLDAAAGEDHADLSLNALRQLYLAGEISEQEFDRAVEEKYDSESD